MVLGDLKNSAMTPIKGIGTTVDVVTNGGAWRLPRKRGERITNARSVTRAKRPYKNHSNMANNKGFG